jgi:ribosome biogenesis GTPase / thiamine phosphate phosphatase
VPPKRGSDASEPPEPSERRNPRASDGAGESEERTASATLDDLGWTARFAEAFEPFRSRGLSPARVSLEHTHIYRVLSSDGERLARVAGRLRHDATGRADFPVVGDWVAIEAPEGADARIRAVLPRVTQFTRRAAGNPTEPQVVAANVDVVFLVSGLDGDFNPRRIERYLVTAWDSGAVPVVVLNKADLVEDPEPFVREAERAGRGVAVEAVSARQPGSVDRLRAHLGRGRTAALLGSSGVGKSSIANALIGEERFRTREVRESDSRGRHTSTSRQLVVLPGGGILIDTPGMRELQLWDTGEAVAGAFADVESIAEDCRFRDCRHASEPGCAVVAAVEHGTLAVDRLESYRKLQAEQKHQAGQQDERARIESKRAAKIGAKALRARLKEKG